MSDEFSKYLRLKGMKQYMPVYDMPKCNDVVKHLNRSLLKMVCMIIHMTGLLKSLSGEVITYMVWLKNHTFTCRLGMKMLYKMLYKAKLSLANISAWGCPVKVYDTSGIKLNACVHNEYWVSFDPDSGSNSHCVLLKLRHYGGQA